MTITKTSKNIISAMCASFVTFLTSMPAKHGKVKIEDILKALEGQELQETFEKVIKDNIPKQKRVKDPNAQKKLKDPNAPKGYRTAYILYSMDVRPDITEELLKEAKKEAKKKAKNEDKKLSKEELEAIKVAPTKIVQRISEVWKSLDDEEKKQWIELSNEEKDRYKKEMETYVRPSNEELAELDVNKKKRRSKKSDSDSDSEKKPRKKKDPNAPKRPVTAYHLYCKDNRAQVKQRMVDSNEDVSGGAVTKELSRMWKELKELKNDDSLDIYKNRVDEDKKRYKKEMESYTPPATDDEEQSDSPNVPRAPKRGRPKLSTGSSDEDTETEKPKRKRAKKRAGEPKRPATAYQMYLLKCIPEMREEDETLSYQDARKIASASWKELTDDEKAPYEEQHKEAKKEYTKRKAEWDKLNPIKEETEEEEAAEPEEEVKAKKTKKTKKAEPVVEEEEEEVKVKKTKKTKKTKKAESEVEEDVSSADESVQVKKSRPLPTLKPRKTFAASMPMTVPMSLTEADLFGADSDSDSDE